MVNSVNGTTQTYSPYNAATTTASEKTVDEQNTIVAKTDTLEATVEHEPIVYSPANRRPLEPRGATEEERAALLNRAADMSATKTSAAEKKIIYPTAMFQEGTLGHYIMGALEGKVDNTSRIADELVWNIQGTMCNKNGTVEERALNREIAVKNAEYIAANYFDNPDDAKKFLDEIKRCAENDVWREKGYTVVDSSPDIAPHPYFRDPIALPGTVSYNAIAKSRGVDLDSMAVEERDSYEKEIQSNYKDWSKQFLAEFNKKANDVGKIIDTLKNSVKSGDYSDLIQKSLERISKAF